MIDNEVRSELEYYLRYGLGGTHKSLIKDEIYEVEFENSAYSKYFKKLLENERIKTADSKNLNVISIPMNQNIDRVIENIRLQYRKDLKESMDFHKSVIEFLSRNFNPILTSGRESGIIKFKMVDGGEKYALNELKNLGFNVSLENNVLTVDISDTVKEMFNRVSKVFDMKKMSPYYAFSVTSDEADEKCKMLDELNVPYKYSDVHNEIYVDLDSLEHIRSKLNK